MFLSKDVSLVADYGGAQTVNFFNRRQPWLFALNESGNNPEWCVDFTTNANRDFSRRVSVNVTDTNNVQRFSLKAFGERLNENVISATEDAAVMFVESGSVSGQDPVFVDLDLTVGRTTTLALGGNIALGSRKGELITLEVTTVSGVVSSRFPVTVDGFFGFTVRTGGALRKIRFLALNDDNGAGGEIFVLDNVCGSSTVAAIRPVTVPTPVAPAPVG